MSQGRWLPLPLLERIPASWSGTADDLVEEVARMVRGLGLAVKPPSVRTIRLWRTKRLLGREAGRRFKRRQILEALAAAVLFERGWSTTAIVDHFAEYADADLERTIREATTGVDAAPVVTVRDGQRRGNNDAAEEAAILLAQGILLQYRRILPGREIIRQGDEVPPELQAAMCRLGRLYITEGSEDRAACVHDVLARARFPLGGPKWGLTAFQAEGFRFADAVLIEPDLKVPTADCASIAAIPGGFGEDNVVENRLHTRLRESAERLGSRRHEAYSGIRELLARHSLVDERMLIDFLDERGLSLVLSIVVEEFYGHVPDAWLIRGRVHRCAHCRTLMRPHPDRRRYADGICPIRQCASKRAPEVGERLVPEAALLLVANSQVLTYWTGPGIDELAIYDEARQLGLDAELYPESDMCDISVGGRAIGIDAKSYSSPISLGLRLNRGIGGLINYRRRFIAVGDEMVATNPDYVATLRSALVSRGDPSTLEIMDVSSVIAMLREMRRAKEA